MCIRDRPETGRLENMRGKTVMLFTPHPDDDTFCCAGTLYKLAKNGNQIHIVIYTNDDKGSYDPDMTSERLARIRMHEEEEACRILGIAKESILWLQYHDGMLEYANPRDLVEQVTGLIRKYRPDVVLSVDPGADSVRWHKTCLLYTSSCATSRLTSRSASKKSLLRPRCPRLDLAWHKCNLPDILVAPSRCWRAGFHNRSNAPHTLSLIHI